MNLPKSLTILLLLLAGCVDGKVKFLGPGAKDCSTVVEYGGQYSGAVVKCRLRYEADKVTCYMVDGSSSISLQCLRRPE